MNTTAFMALPYSGPPTSRAQFRRLAKDKHNVENRLIDWGKWTRMQEQGALPCRSVTEKAKEGGIAAGSPRPPTALPDEVAEIDRIIARLSLEYHEIARCNWQYSELTREQRFARFVSRTGSRDSLGTFKRRVEDIRNVVRMALPGAR